MSTCIYNSSTKRVRVKRRSPSNRGIDQQRSSHGPHHLCRSRLHSGGHHRSPWSEGSSGLLDNQRCHNGRSEVLARSFWRKSFSLVSAQCSSSLQIFWAQSFGQFSLSLPSLFFSSQWFPKSLPFASSKISPKLARTLATASPRSFESQHLLVGSLPQMSRNWFHKGQEYWPPRLHSWFWDSFGRHPMHKMCVQQGAGKVTAVASSNENNPISKVMRTNWLPILASPFKKPSFHRSPSVVLLRGYMRKFVLHSN